MEKDRAVLELRGVTYEYPRASSDVPAESVRSQTSHVDLSVAPGECIALIGPNGAGKSTIAKLLCGTLTPLTGSVCLDGARASKDELHRVVAYVRQDPESQIIAPTVFEEVAFGPCNLGLSENEVRSRVAECLTLCELEGYQECMTSALSGGEKQRLALASVLAMRPRYLVLDEVTSQLDARARQHTHTILHKVRAGGTGIVLITHDTQEMALASRVVELADCFSVQEVPPTTPAVTPVGSRSAHQAAEFDSQGFDIKPGGLDLILRDISLSYDSDVILSNVNLTCPKGTLTIIEGASGSGKTSLARIACGLHEPDSGSAKVGSKPVAPGNVALCAQRCEDQLFCNTVIEDVAFGPRNLGLSQRDAQAKAKHALRALGVDKSLWQRSPFTLSGGQKRRVALASILALEADGYVLDEPTVGLDTEGKQQLFSFVKRLLYAGYPILLITHDPCWSEYLTSAEADDTKVQRLLLHNGVLKEAEEALSDKESAMESNHSVSKLHTQAQQQSQKRNKPKATRSYLPFGSYTNRNTALHRLDARVKMLLLILVTIAAFMAATPPSLALLALSVIVCAAEANISAHDSLRALKPTVLILLFSLLSNALVVDGSYDLQLLGMLGVRYAGILRGVMVVVRIAILVAASLILTSTTSSTQIADALASILAPLERLGAPVGDFSMTVSLVLRFIPLTSEELNRIHDAQRARGVDFGTGSIFQRLRHWLSVFVPLIVALLRRAEDIACAMEERCYTGRGRTRMAHPMGATDIGATVAGIVVCVVVCLL